MRTSAAPHQLAVIAANRFGLGARVGDLDTIAAEPRGWLLDQLAGPTPLEDEIEALPGSCELLAEAQAARRADRAARREEPDTERRYGRLVRRSYNPEPRLAGED